MLLTRDAIQTILKKYLREFDEKDTNALTREFYDISFANVPQLLREGSYLFYEFNDKKIEYQFDEKYQDKGTYVKYISPLFAPKVINEDNNKTLLSIIEDSIPFYHLEPSGPVTVDLDELSSTRDCGINDVASPLQDSPFYETWFREAQGYIYNKLILDIYNKLRYPVLTETQYLNASLFPTLASSAFTSTSNPESLIEFRTSVLENSEDNNYYDEDEEGNKEYSKVGCLDYLNNIIAQRLQATYALLDYQPGQMKILTDWGNSLYGSGRLTLEELSSQLSVYKLQDINYELLRRKFAGSKLLYNLALASIDRQGSFIATMPAGALSTTSTLFKDKRLVRVINLPGITTQLSTNIYNTDPIGCLSKGDSTPSINNIASIFYSSAAASNSDEYFDAEKFYIMADKAYRGKFYRDNSNVITWDSLSGLTTGKSLVYIYPTLDEQLVDPDYESGLRLRTLDDYNDNGEMLHLDAKTILASESAVTGNVFDLSANRLLYNRNSVQDKVGGNYPYITYPIADGNSISLIDSTWIDYLKSLTEDKSRVQDNVSFGAQVSKYYHLPRTQLAERHFYGISYSDSDVDDSGNTLTIDKLKLGKYTTSSRFAYLWYCTLEYGALTYKPYRLTTTLVSKIALCISDNDKREEFTDVDGYEELCNFSQGVLPLTYSELSDDRVLGLRLGLYTDEVQTATKIETQTRFCDDITRSNYTKANFVFSTSDLISETPKLDTSPARADINTSTTQLLSVYPSEETKVLFYVVKKSEGGYEWSEEQGSYVQQLPTYKWSEPIKVIPLTDELVEGLTGAIEGDDDTRGLIYPDWYHLGYYLNPYLNFTTQSASPLRHKKVIGAYRLSSLDIRASLANEILVGPSENAGLCNLARVRGMEFTCNDSGNSTLPVEWVDASNSEASKIQGFYLNRICPDPTSSNSPYPERVSIYGDNRFSDFFDTSSNTAVDSVNARSTIKRDNNSQIQCLSFEFGGKTDESEDVSENLLILAPSKYERKDIITDKGTFKNGLLTPITASNYNSWYWNQDADGITICANISLPLDNLKKFNATVAKDPKMLIAGREGEFELYLEFAGTMVKDTFEASTFRVHFEALGNSIETESIALNTNNPTEALKNYRIAASTLYLKDTIVTTLSVNNKTYKSETANSKHITFKTPKASKSKDILIASKYEVEEINRGEVGKAYRAGGNKYYRWDNTKLTYILLTPEEIQPVQDLKITADELRDMAADKFVAYFSTALVNIGSNKEFKLTVITTDASIDRYFVTDDNSKIIEVEIVAAPVNYKVRFNQSNCFYGSLYDLRLYRKGFEGLGLALIAAGTTRELYSYAPTTYVLGYNIHRDLGVFKEVNLRERNDGSALMEDVDAIRVFNRGVWDSILTDMYPTAEEETQSSSAQFKEDYRDPQDDADIYGWVNGEFTYSDCIQQVLNSVAEVNNNVIITSNSDNFNQERVRVTYGGKDVVTSADSGNTLLTLVNTTLYPVHYNRDPLTTVGSRFSIMDNIISTTTNGAINLPSALDPTNGVLTYEADLNLNFTISPEVDFTNWYSHGVDVEAQYSNTLMRPVIRLTQTQSSAGTSQSNHVLVPLTIPAQKDLSYAHVGYLDKFVLNGVELNSGISTLLKASTYYNELRVPVAHSNISQKNWYNTLAWSSLSSKWDALRGLKEGTYYITCKYPMQILPFEDYLYNTDTQARYAAVYATARFKVEVKGTPIKYVNGLNNAEDIVTNPPAKYYADNLRATLESESALIHPRDNRTFPHRQINIDFYVQDCNDGDLAGKMLGNEEYYGFTWRLLGTNHPTDYPNSTDYIYLDKDRLEGQLVLTQNIPLFLSKNYTSSFFIAKTERLEEGNVTKNPASADDDLIEPIRINPCYGSDRVTSYVRVSGEADPTDTYYINRRGVFTKASPQPEPYTSLDPTDDQPTTYYVKVEGLDRLTASNERDLDKLILAAGRSYKLLWDYSGYVSELSYTDTVYSDTSSALATLTSSKPYYTMTNAEKVNYARMSNLLDPNNTTEYMYSQLNLEYGNRTSKLPNTLSGYCVSNSKFKLYNITDVDSVAAITPESIIKDYGDKACKTYTECAVINYIEGVEPIEGVVYKTAEGTYKVKGDSGYVNLAAKTLDLSKPASWEFKKYYTYNDNSGTRILRAVLTNNISLYRVGNDMYYWQDIAPVKFENVIIINSDKELPSAGRASYETVYVLRGSNGAYKLTTTNSSNFTDPSNEGTTPFYYGNPYSKSSKHNYLLKVRDSSSTLSRDSIINSGYFPYVPTEVPSDSYMTASLIQGSIDAINSAYGDLVTTEISEASIIKAHHTNMLSKAKAAIVSLTASNSRGSKGDTSGVFTALSKITPHIEYRGPELEKYKVADKSYVRSSSDTLYAYYASDRTLPSKNSDVEITRRGLYSNNLIVNQDFDNTNAWKWLDATQGILNTYSANYVSDDDWDKGSGKDVCEVEYISTNNNGEVGYTNSSSPIVMKYLAGSSKLGATYEVALNVKVLSNNTYDPLYLWNGTSYTLVSNSNIVRCDSTIRGVGDLPAKGDGSKLYFSKTLLTAWKYDANTKVYSAYKLAYYTGEGKGADDTLYVDSPAKNLEVDVLFLVNDKNVKAGYCPKLISTSLSQGDGNEVSEVLLSNTWYNLSYETESIVEADTIAYAFKCKATKEKSLKFRITKAVIRRSESKSHALGLADGLYTKSSSGNSAYVCTTSHRSVVYKNKKTKELLPVQFNSEVCNRPGTSTYDRSSVSYVVNGLNKAQEFIDRYKLGKTATDNKLELLRDPFVRRLHYNKKLSGNIQNVYVDYDKDKGELGLYTSVEEIPNDDGVIKNKYYGEVTPIAGAYYYIINGNHSTYYRYNTELKRYEEAEGANGQYYELVNNVLSALVDRGPFEETVTFTKYITQRDSYGLKSAIEDNTECTDIYSEAIIKMEKVQGTLSSNFTSCLNVKSIKVNTTSTSPLKSYNTNLVITNEAMTTVDNEIIANGPVTISNENVSALINCFDLNAYDKNMESKAIVTNIQLLTKANTNGIRKILYEIEYPPIIYDETSQHISYNIMLSKDKN